MKFLGIGTMKEASLAVPPAVGRQMMEASLAVISQNKKEVKILEFYFASGWGRSVVIAEAKTAEELLKDILAMPIASYLDMEVYPLADGFEAMKMYIDTLKAAEKMMPGAPK